MNIRIKFLSFSSLQISKLETDIQRLNQILEKQKYLDMHLRTQVSDLKIVRKELEDLRTENSDLKTKFVIRSFLKSNKKRISSIPILHRYDSVNTQRQRDKQRLTDLERTLNEERQNRLRLESHVKTEKSLTKKLQDDLTKLNLISPKLVLLLSFCFCRIFSSFHHRNECTEQCIRRKRDLENETREIRKLLNDKDERVKVLENEIKVRNLLLQ